MPWTTTDIRALLLPTYSYLQTKAAWCHRQIHLPMMARFLEAPKSLSARNVHLYNDDGRVIGGQFRQIILPWWIRTCSLYDVKIVLTDTLLRGLSERISDTQGLL